MQFRRRCPGAFAHGHIYRYVSRTLLFSSPHPSLSLPIRSPSLSLSLFLFFSPSSFSLHPLFFLLTRFFFYSLSRRAGGRRGPPSEALKSIRIVLWLRSNTCTRLLPAQRDAVTERTKLFTCRLYRRFDGSTHTIVDERGIDESRFTCEVDRYIDENGPVVRKKTRT